jgi:peptidoglycan hydrolase-like protein with peptidoglycan-binding domain
MLQEVPHNKGLSRRVRLRYVVPVLVALPFLAIAAGLVLVASSHPSIRVGGNTLAVIKLPRGGGQIVRVIAIGGREQQAIPVKLVGHQVLPAEPLKPGERLTVQATIKRPGWVSWLTGKEEQVQVSETTPVARLASAFLTHKRGEPVRVDFSAPVVKFGAARLGSRVITQALTAPRSSYALSESASAGTAQVAVAARSWEIPSTTTITWFPAGTKATAITTPAPGTKITPNTKITLTFSKPVTRVLGTHASPPVSPRTPGTWHRLNAHTIQFVPEGYGYGLGADVSVSLPEGVNLQGGQVKGSDPIGRWTVPDGSTLALQQLLAQLGYLPVNFVPTDSSNDIAPSPAAEEAAIVDPPAGRFVWRYPNTPATLRSLWQPNSYTQLTKGAVMAFESDQGLPTDGVPGVDVWKALINAAVHGQSSKFGYTFVMVHEAPSNETINVWHNGKVAVHGPANTGIAAAPTATGTYPVYLRETVGTMSGKNPDGSTYHDPGIPWISYFNGGDALHGFIRGSYGFPQSLGCVEMPFSEAGQVYPYTPIGTLVNVAT